MRLFVRKDNLKCHITLELLGNKIPVFSPSTECQFEKPQYLDLEMTTAEVKSINLLGVQFETVRHLTLQAKNQSHP